jgi:hypothetical protein
LAESTESDIMNGNIMYFNDLSKISRQVSNLKSKLLESGELIENCLWIVNIYLKERVFLQN